MRSIGTATGGGTIATSQSPFNTNQAERAVAGNSYPNVSKCLDGLQGTVFSEQKVWSGRLLGGYSVNTIWSYNTGQVYTPDQSSKANPPNGSVTRKSQRPIRGRPSGASATTTTTRIRSETTAAAQFSPTNPLQSVQLASMAVQESVISTMVPVLPSREIPFTGYSTMSMRLKRSVPRTPESAVARYAATR